tara:strand:- start:303 stop:500 length:198 start_codon:yes stop_codon:yes gene_type:complete
MIQSEVLGRTFWLDANNNFKSAPTYIDNTIAYEQRDYVSEWTEWSDVDMHELFSIHHELVLARTN